MIISATSEQAKGFLGDIKLELETNIRLFEDFPEVCEINKKPVPTKWTRNELITKNNIKITALGVNQQIRGRRNRENRPSLIVLDDIESGDSLITPEVGEKLHNWIEKAVLKSGTSETNIIYIGTIHHYGSMLSEFVDDKKYPGWYKRVYKSVISWSVNQNLWCDWEKIFNSYMQYKGEEGPEAAKQFYTENLESMLKNTEVLWPESKNYYDLMVLREQEGHYSFDSEMQNEPVNPKDCYFNLEEISYWDDEYSSEEELMRIIENKGSFVTGGSCDPSLGKKNGSGDYTAIFSAVLDNESGTIYILDADIARRRPDDTIESIIEYHKIRKYDGFAFETNQFQEFMASELEERSAKSGFSINVEPVNHVKDKFTRIVTLQPMIKSGKIKFSHKHRMLLEQMKYFPKGRYDDGLDALEMVVSLCKEIDGGFLKVVIL